MSVIKTFVALFLFALLASCGADLPEGVEIAMIKVPEVVDYNIHVRPIFSDRCYACHGPDAGSIKGGLQLHSPETAYKESIERPGTYHLALKDDRLEMMLAHTTPYNAITKYATMPLPREEWVHLTLTYDGSSRAKALRKRPGKSGGSRHRQPV